MRWLNDVGFVLGIAVGMLIIVTGIVVTGRKRTPDRWREFVEYIIFGALMFVIAFAIRYS